MSAMSWEIDELLNEAVMTGVPIVLVEGVDDISTYHSIGGRVSFDIEIYAIENIDGYTEGCEQVIAALNELHNLPLSENPIKNHILGIIDKDVRDYRQECPQIESLLILKYYSIESHFVSKNILEHALGLCTKANNHMISDNDIQLLMDAIEEQLIQKLYYFSLEALKNALEPEYCADFSYSFKAGRINTDLDAKEKITEKTGDLDNLASTFGLSPSLNTLKLITKGKWLIDFFANEIIIELNNLPSLCKTEKITVCQFCLNQSFDKCLYRLKEGINKNSIKNFSVTCVDGEEFSYIVNHIEQMKL